MKIWVSPPGRAFGLAEVLAKTEENTRCTANYGSIALDVTSPAALARITLHSTPPSLVSFPRKRSPKQDELSLEST